MFTDIVGYTALTQRNESGTIRLLEEHRQLIRPLVANHKGLEVKTIGDAFLFEFASALDATLCAIAVQNAMNDRKLSHGERLAIRIGVHIGDVIQKENDVLGDTVNIASRIEPLADPGGVCVSEQVWDQVKNKIPYPLVKIGTRELKNVAETVEVYKVTLPWEQSASPESSAYPSDRIAVLPFRNMSPDPNDEYFAEGITEEIISAVSGISSLKVISRTSVMGYKGTTKKVAEIGKELKVGSVLEGSFRKAGNRIRVTTQLINVAGDEHLWAQNYDRNLDDVFEVQSDIAKRVADALRVRILTPEKERIEKKPTESVAAHTLYLKGRYLWNKRGLEDLRKASECFELAVHEDPSFALGYVGLADCALLIRNNWGIDPEYNLEKARSLATKALELDAELAEAHATRGLVHVSEFNLMQAEEEFEKAIELKPSSANAHIWYNLVLRAELRMEEALVEIQKTLELDPLSTVAYLNLGVVHLLRKEYEKASDQFIRASELGQPAAAGYLAETYGKTGRYEDMKRELDRYVGAMKEPYPRVREAADLLEAFWQGDEEGVRRRLPEVEAAYRETGLQCYNIACFHLFLGEKDKALEWLERSYSQRETLALVALQSDPELDGIRNDPGYAGLLKKLGLG